MVHETDLIVSFPSSETCHCFPLPSTVSGLVIQGFRTPSKPHPPNLVLTYLKPHPSPLSSCLIHFSSQSYGSLSFLKCTCVYIYLQLFCLICFFHLDCPPLSSLLKRKFVHYPRLRFLKNISILLVKWIFLYFISSSVMNMMIISYVLQTAVHTTDFFMRFQIP